MQRLKQLQHAKPMVVGIGIAMAILLVALIYVFIQFNAPQLQSRPEQVRDQLEAPAPKVAPETDTPNFTSDIALIDEDIVTAAVSEDATLAEDELAQLDDIQQQLSEQKALLEQQHATADQLIALKQQQIAALEAELKAQ